MEGDRKQFINVDEFFANMDSLSELVELEGFLERDPLDGAQSRLALNGDCKSWVTIPNNAIRTIEIVKTNAICYTEAEGYHTHPYVKLYLTHNESTGKVLSQVISKLALSQRLERKNSRSKSHFSKSDKRRFKLRTSDVGDCADDERCVGGVSRCEYGCACCNDDDECYCSTCCVA